MPRGLIRIPFAEFGRTEFPWKVLDIHVESRRREIRVLIEHEVFPEVSDAEPLPLARAEYLYTTDDGEPFGLRLVLEDPAR